MADMISGSEAKNILGCDDATLNNHINSGAIRASREGGKLAVSREDVLRLSSGSDSDDGTLILASESDDFSIDLGDVIDDTAATMANAPGESDEAQITFSDSDGLEMPDLDDDNTQEMSSTGETSDLSFTESNTAVVTSVDETMIDETMIDQTAADLQTVDYGDSDAPTGRSSGRSSQRSVRGQAVSSVEETPVHAVWPSLLAVTMALMLFTIPYFYLAMWHGDNSSVTGERIPGADDAGMLTNLANSIVGFSTEPEEAKFKATHPNQPWMAVPKVKDSQANVWRYKQWLGDAANAEERIKSFIIDAVELVDGVPTKAIIINGQSQITLDISEVKQDVNGGEPTEGVYSISLD